MSVDEKIKTFLETVLGQVQEWLEQKKVHKITLVITNINTKEVLEKWDFKVDYEGETPNGSGSNGDPANLSEVGKKDISTIQKEIREVIRQITGKQNLLMTELQQNCLTPLFKKQEEYQLTQLQYF